MTSPPKPGSLPAILDPETTDETRTKHAPLWYVILHDDQLHTYQYVIEMLTNIFRMNTQKALIHAIEVDSCRVSGREDQTVNKQLGKTRAR